MQLNDQDVCALNRTAKLNASSEAVQMAIRARVA